MLDSVIDVTGTQEKASAHGGKTIGYFGSFALIINNITGPAMVTIPNLFQMSGWLVPTLIMLLVMVISTLSATMMVDAMGRMPGNERFTERVELTTLSRKLLPRWAHVGTLGMFVFSLQSSNVASIIVSAQTMDLAFVAIKSTCGLEFYPHFRWTCPSTDGTSITPFGSAYVLSLGFLVVLAIAVPLGFFNLDDNIIVQNISTVIMVGIIGFWMIIFCLAGLKLEDLPTVTSAQAGVLGTIIFNYAYVVSVPSWANEKREHVSFNRVLWGSAIASTLLFFIIGVGGALAFQFTGSQDILNKLAQASFLPAWLLRVSQISVFVFPAVVLISGIPVFSVITRYNLIEDGICNKAWANFWSVVFPWAIAVPFYTGSGLQNVISWAGLFLQGTINFVIPLLLYIIARRRFIDPRESKPLMSKPSFVNLNSSAEGRAALKSPFLYSTLSHSSLAHSASTPALIAPTGGVSTNDIGPGHSASHFGRAPSLAHSSSGGLAGYGGLHAGVLGTSVGGTHSTAESAQKVKPFRAIPDWVPGEPLAIALCVAVVALILACIVIDITFVAKGKSLVG